MHLPDDRTPSGKLLDLFNGGRDVAGKQQSRCAMNSDGTGVHSRRNGQRNHSATQIDLPELRDKLWWQTWECEHDIAQLLKRSLTRGAYYRAWNFCHHELSIGLVAVRNHNTGASSDIKGRAI